ncbi:LysR family transcriptional regulator [Actinoplanes sp. CA-252034]|uniref:LysR family transcriptional regulator n=1 Tax=Actinoplanes sp. CA-252034 TaxID=3239906 RepID=UPI003D99D0F0
MNVELRHLRALAAIGDEGTISAAAAVLRISQPALSRTLDQLERRIGTTLVERTTRRLALTDAGRRLHERAHLILNQLDDALAEAAAGPQPLHVGFAWAALGDHTVSLLRTWRDEHPAAPVRVHRRDDPETALRRGELNAAIVRLMPSPPGDLLSAELYREPRLAAVPDGHPLAGRPSVRLADLSDQRVVLCSTSATTGQLWPRDQRPHTFDVANVDEWLTTIATGEAVGVTAQGTERSHPYPGIRYLPITDGGTVTVWLLWPRVPTHPATGAFIDHARRAVAAVPPPGS